MVDILVYMKNVLNADVIAVIEYLYKKEKSKQSKTKKVP